MEEELPRQQLPLLLSGTHHEVMIRRHRGQCRGKCGKKGTACKNTLKCVHHLEANEAFQVSESMPCHSKSQSFW